MWNLPRAALSLLLFFSMALSLLGAEFYLQSTNTLIHHPHWESKKLSLDKAVNGALAFMVTPVALHRNHLNLGAWYGYQELWWKDPVDASEISFDLFIPPQSLLTFLYNKTAEGFLGIRLSRNSLYESCHFRANFEGRFLQKDTFKPPSLDEGWNHIRILFENSETTLWVNGKEGGQFLEKLERPQKIGFRGGHQSTLIDNVEIRLKDPPKVLRESFQNPHPFWPVWGKIFLFFLFLNFVLIFWVLRKKEGSDRKKVFYTILLTYFVFLILSPLFYFTYYGFLSNQPSLAKLYFKGVTRIYGYQSNIETKEEIVARLHQQMLKKDTVPPFRILFLGSSQTWGAGASQSEKTFVYKLEEMLNENNPSKNYQIINAGISGEKSFGLYTLYTNEWIQWKPKMVVINLSNNDVDSDRFSETLRKFIQFNLEKGIKTVFVLEANAPEAIKESLLPNHKRMRSVAKEWNIPLIDLHGCLTQKYDEGILWWDFVHPTDLGHQWAAECLSPIFCAAHPPFTADVTRFDRVLFLERYPSKN